MSRVDEIPPVTPTPGEPEDDRPLQPDAEGDPDALLAAYLIACEEALASGRTPPPCPTGADDPEFARRLHDCLALIQQLWPRGPDPAADTGASTLSADVTWFNTPNLEAVGADAKVENEPGPDRLGRFRIVRELGRGGFGVVFLAEDPLLNRPVALKVPLLEVLTRPSVRRRFLNEARATAALDHPNLVPVLEARELGPICYIATAYCDGPTLEKWTKRQTQPIPPRTAARLVAALAGAMQHVHERGILHRDLKPANVLFQSVPARSGSGSPAHAPDAAEPVAGVVEGWIPRITDFGLAKVLDEATEATQSGMPIGSPSYMAPEQAQGRLRELGPWTDVYALGVIFYELLVGRPPHKGETPMETVRSVIVDEPTPPRRLRPDVPRDLEAIVLRCLEKEPRHRYRTAADLAADLARFLAGEPILARPASVPERAWKWSRRHPLGATLLVAAALLPAVIIAGLAHYNAMLREYNEDLEGETRRADQYAEIAWRHLHSDRLHQAREALDLGEIERAQDILDAIGHQPRGFELRAFEPRGFCWGYLHRLARRDMEPLRSDRNVHEIALSPDGRTLAGRLDGGTVGLWDVASRRLVHTLDAGGQRSIYSAAFSPDGHLLVTSTHELDQAHASRLSLWNVATGRLIAFLEPPRPGCALVNFPDFVGPNLLASVWGQGDDPLELSVQDLAPDPARPRACVDLGGFRDFRFAAQAGRVAVVDERGILSLLDARTGAVQGKLPEPLNTGRLWTFSPDGQTVAIETPDRGILFHDVATGLERVCDPIAAPIRELLFSPEGATLAVVEPTGLVHLRDRATGRGPTLRPDSLIRPERDVDLAFSPDGRRVALTAYGVPGGRGPITQFRAATGRRGPSSRGVRGKPSTWPSRSTAGRCSSAAAPPSAAGGSTGTSRGTRPNTPTRRGPSPSRLTAGPSPPAATTTAPSRRSPCGTPPTADDASPGADIPRGPSPAWRTPRTAASSPRAPCRRRTTSGCGTPTAGPCSPRCPATPASCARSPSARMARSSPPPARTSSSASGTSPPAASCASCRATPTPFAPLPSTPTADGSPPRATIDP